MSRSNKRPIEIHGHRGARGRVPENTLASIEFAYACGVQSVEVDVAYTLDEELVIFHDFTLNPNLVRGADGEFISSHDIALRSKTLAQLSQFDVGQIRPGTDYAKLFSEQQSLTHAAIPTLKDVVNLVRHLPGKPYLTIEIKSSPVKPTLCVPPTVAARRLIETLDQLAVPVERDLISSFDWRVLAAVQELEPDLRTSYLTVQQPNDDTVANKDATRSLWTGDFDIRDYHGKVAHMVSDAGGNGWSPNFKDIDADTVEEAHSLGLIVSVWTVNEPDDIDAMIQFGVDIIISDYPDRVRERLDAHVYRSHRRSAHEYLTIFLQNSGTDRGSEILLILFLLNSHTCCKS